ncbi:putative metal-binding protein [Flavobacterium arsenatis]|uniref:Metal-binding protein n=1 Tax=Flavobacterium arsenatis TaxID=1484332 RepID=A0ABU1TJP0_9FLAO|nr:DUF2683 family protein [Flavobacterium arsenatis]MDR6966193.1 putative metal-binding protein [Flavobacterium arsenatis]
MESFIVHPKNQEERNVVKAFLEALKIKFEKTTEQNPDESPYNPEFVATMEKSKQDFKEGKITRINLDDIWK